MGKIRGCLVTVVLLSFLVQSCYRNDIDFGNLPNNNYTNVVFTDTVAPSLSTVVLDSFVTSTATSFLIGKYKDPYLGIVSTQPFFQLTVPPFLVSIPTASQYDSMCLIISPNKYYYGDTTRPQTFTVHELDDFLNFTYNDHIFNTSNFAVKPVPLGSRTVTIRPSKDDSVVIRLDDNKGRELFTKLEQQASETGSDIDFQNYFKGITISTGSGDTAAVYGINASDTDLVMRLFYHTTTPYLLSQAIDFPYKPSAYSFNQIITDRTGTPLFSSARGIVEVQSAQSNNVVFTQYGAGVLAKVTFPTLKGILSTDKIVELQKAELVLKPIPSSYDFNKFKLPDNLSLYQTDETNTVGAVAVSDVPPVTDEIYGTGAYFKFDVTAFINTLLTTAGTEDKGFFLMGNTSAPNVTRAVIGDSRQPVYTAQLLITAIIINK